MPYLWLADIPMTAGQQEIIPCRIRNTTNSPFVLEELTAAFLHQSVPHRRRISHELLPGAQCTVGLPFFAHRPGRYLLTRLDLYATAGGRIFTWQTRDEIAFKVLSEETSGPSVYQVHLRDYALILGDIHLKPEGLSWHELPLFPAHSAPGSEGECPDPGIGLDYCCLKISTSNLSRYWYICSREEAYLGRSSSVEFQVLLRDRSPEHPENLQISARQAKIYSRHGQWHIEDSGSLNGTRVNGIRIRERFPLHEGDIVKLGEALDLAVSVSDRERPSFAAIKLCHRDAAHSDSYVMLTGNAVMGSLAHCAIHVPGSCPHELAYLRFARGYRLQPLCECRYNGRNLPICREVGLRPGDELCLGNTVVEVVPGDSSR